MARKKTTLEPTTPMVSFDLNDRTYQIDPDQKKVYRRFVEIETARASEIISLWRVQLAAS